MIEVFIMATVILSMILIIKIRKENFILHYTKCDYEKMDKDTLNVFHQIFYEKSNPSRMKKSRFNIEMSERLKNIESEMLKRG